MSLFKRPIRAGYVPEDVKRQVFSDIKVMIDFVLYHQGDTYTNQIQPLLERVDNLEPNILRSLFGAEISPSLKCTLQFESLGDNEHFLRNCSNIISGLFLQLKTQSHGLVKNLTLRGFSTGTPRSVWEASLHKPRSTILIDPKVPNARENLIDAYKKFKVSTIEQNINEFIRHLYAHLERNLIGESHTTSNFDTEQRNGSEILYQRRFVFNVKCSDFQYEMNDK